MLRELKHVKSTRTQSASMIFRTSFKICETITHPLLQRIYLKALQCVT